MKGQLYAGLDLGRAQDHSVLAVIKQVEDQQQLIHCHQFPLKTSYGNVIGYVKVLCDRWNQVHKVLWTRLEWETTSWRI